MKIVIDIIGNNKFKAPNAIDIQKNIDAIQRAIDGKTKSHDFVLLIDTKSILEGIQRQLLPKQLPRKLYKCTSPTSS